MSLIYDGPGKARKQCPACQKYIHARSTICPACDHELKEGAKAKLAEREAKAEADKTKGGRGLKQCPGCKNYVGVRTQLCECGNDFSVTGSVTKEQPKDPAHIEAIALMTAIGYTRKRILYVPSGGAPIKLKSSKKEVVFKWCEDNLNHFLNLDYFMSPHCVRYLVRQQGFEEKTRLKVMEHVKAWQQEYLDSYEPPVDNTDWEQLAEITK